MLRTCAEICGLLHLEQPAAAERRQIAQKLRLQLSHRHRIHDHVRPLRGVEHRRGRQPARGVEPVAEDNQQRAPGVRLSDRDAGKDAVDERRVALADKCPIASRSGSDRLVSAAPSMT